MKDINPGQVYAILAAQLVLTMAFIGLFFISFSISISFSFIRKVGASITEYY